MRDIDDQEWKAYVTKCTTGEWPVPPGFVSDKNNWLCRAIVGRVLYFIKDVEGALTVLSTFINDVEPDMEDHPDQGMPEISLPVSHGSPGRYLVPAAEHSGGKRQTGTGCHRSGRDGEK